MIAARIPGWLAKLDDEPPYIEVLDGEQLPDVSPYLIHGLLAGQIVVQLAPWAKGRGTVAVEVRFYFLRAEGTWSSLLPDVCYMSFARLPWSMADEVQRPRIAPDIAIEILSPGDRPGRVKRKIETYLEFGSMLVLVVNPRRRRVALHHADGTVEERDARGSWPVEPFDDLVLDWDEMFRELGIS